ncbi:hypothetical protein DPMN_106765, partial [Dreissena polymorpha]
MPNKNNSSNVSKPGASPTSACNEKGGSVGDEKVGIKQKNIIEEEIKFNNRREHYC